MTDANSPQGFETNPEPTEHIDEHADLPEQQAMSPRAKRLSWIIGIVILAACAVLVWFVAGSDSGGGGMGGPGGPGGPGRGATTVGIATSAGMDIPITIDALGTVEPAATVTVTPQVSGRITQILFTEGQLVQKGQALAVIDRRPYQAALTQAEGALQRDRAQLADARLTLQRYQTLLSQDSIARQDVDTQKALVQQLEGTVKVDQGAVDDAKLNLEFATVRAPVYGRVGLRLTDLGNYISAGDTTGIATITTLAPIDVSFSVPQDLLPELQREFYAGQSMTVAAKDQSRDNVLANGKFLTLDNSVSTDTGTVTAKARFANRDGALYPSQFVNVVLELKTLENAVTVPSTAVREDDDGSYVWVVGSDKTVKQRRVTTGPSSGDQVVIDSGLKIGEKVVTAGGDRLTDGGTVTAAEDPQAAASQKQAKTEDTAE